MLPSSSFWKGKRVLITGHTGFKGSWLSLWLHSYGAEVYGLSLDPPTVPNLFSLANISNFLTFEKRINIGDEERVLSTFLEFNPEIVFHLAAQALVRESYNQPSYTFTTNTLGTAFVCEAIRKTPSVKVAVMITTDKVYDNREWLYPYREIDVLGGDEPYSASKACAEMIINSYRSSFLTEKNISISSVRAGNVIGGGDWSKDRLIPDAIRAFVSNKTLHIRNPDAIRPWQHVLDVLCGYLLLAEKQWSDPFPYARAWNFAPDNGGEATVGDIAEYLVELWGGGAHFSIVPSSDGPFETGVLRLDSSMARTHLGWRSKWSLHNALEKTIEWYKYWYCGGNLQEYSLNQIKLYTSGDSP
jgi:CDP-glucose 4,6-dehydratase